MLRQLADDAAHRIGHQLLRPDALDQQPVHRPADVEGPAQQRRALARRIAIDLAEDIRQPQPAPHRIGGGRNVGPGIERVEQRAQRLVEIEIAHHRHARQQQAPKAIAARQPHESLGHGARGAAAGQQQGQPGEAGVGLGIARDQPGGERIGKAAVRGDGIELWPGPLSHRQARPRSARWPRDSQHRTIALDAPARNSGLAQSPGPRKHWSRIPRKADRRSRLWR